MEYSLIMAGFGGQGIMLMGQIFAYSAMEIGKFVTWFPSYGPEMRGGTANCTVVISDEPVVSPIVSEPDCLIIMNLPSLDKFESLLKTGGILLYNTTLIPKKPSRSDIKIYPIPANNLAEEAGNIRSANMVMLGALITIKPLIPLEAIENKVRYFFSENKREFLDINLKALIKGKEYIERMER
ncbi:MAG: 2-oxoacid:acceptor oxidoreductase family protein [Dictyoglomaceae bacterium]